MYVSTAREETYANENTVATLRGGKEVHVWFTKAGRLFEEWVLDQFLKVERQRLNYFSTNDYARRRSSNQLRQGSDQQVARAVADGKRRGSEVGTLAPAVPSTHIGSQLPGQEIR